MPTVLSRAPMSCSSPVASTFPRTADIPRCMLIPWSPSPTAASSCVSCSWFVSTSAAHAVDEREHLVALLKWQVLDDRAREPVDDLGRGRELHPLATGLAVDADPDLHLVVAELEGRLPGRRDDARGQRHAHASTVGVH